MSRLNAAIFTQRKKTDNDQGDGWDADWDAEEWITPSPPPPKIRQRPGTKPSLPPPRIRQRPGKPPPLPPPRIRQRPGKKPPPPQSPTPSPPQSPSPSPPSSPPAQSPAPLQSPAQSAPAHSTITTTVTNAGSYGLYPTSGLDFITSNKPKLRCAELQIKHDVYLYEPSQVLNIMANNASETKKAKISDRYLHSYLTQKFFDEKINNNNNTICMYDDLNMNANDNETITKYADILEEKILLLYVKKINNYYKDITYTNNAIISKFTKGATEQQQKRTEKNNQLEKQEKEWLANSINRFFRAVFVTIILKQSNKIIEIKNYIKQLIHYVNEMNVERLIKDKDTFLSNMTEWTSTPFIEGKNRSELKRTHYAMIMLSTILKKKLLTKNFG